jgi:hypothetical protein
MGALAKSIASAGALLEHSNLGGHPNSPSGTHSWGFSSEPANDGFRTFYAHLLACAHPLRPHRTCAPPFFPCALGFPATHHSSVHSAEVPISRTRLWIPSGASSPMLCILPGPHARVVIAGICAALPATPVSAHLPMAGIWRLHSGAQPSHMAFLCQFSAQAIDVQSTAYFVLYPCTCTGVRTWGASSFHIDFALMLLVLLCFY